MSSASTSPHGFVTVRGRGYRTDQVDAFLEVLSRDRDAAWERAARLTVLAKDMEAEAARMREVVAQLPPQTYESLGGRARRLFQVVLEEAADLRERTRHDAHRQAVQAEVRADSARRRAQAAANALRMTADEYARQRLVAARAEADAIRIGARRAVKEERRERLAGLREVRERAAALEAELSRKQAERWAEVEREEAERIAALDARYADRASRADAALADAERALAEAEEFARRSQEEARARATDIIVAARMHEERLARETDQVLREHGDAWDHVQAHMDEARSDLISLTGRATLE
ncbi:cellulose-binding protein [Streptomyces filipinensis]|uniref:cellulose-binding protein n=1 Tax=Streptomyces filipinensis TaxID=66887 RepID=UPI0017868515|nr:cellulose-binding protein [Streptomyces filipinensis]